MVKVDYSGAEIFFRGSGPNYALAAEAHRTFAEKTGAGADFTGWAELPRRIRDTELDAIVSTAELIRSRSKAPRTTRRSSSRATASAPTTSATCWSSWATWTST